MTQSSGTASPSIAATVGEGWLEVMSRASSGVRDPSSGQVPSRCPSRLPGVPRGTDALAQVSWVTNRAEAGDAREREQARSAYERRPEPGEIECAADDGPDGGGGEQAGDARHRVVHP